MDDLNFGIVVFVSVVDMSRTNLSSVVTYSRLGHCLVHVHIQDQKDEETNLERKDVNRV